MIHIVICDHIPLGHVARCFIVCWFANEVLVIILTPFCWSEKGALLGSYLLILRYPLR